MFQSSPALQGRREGCSARGISRSAGVQTKNENAAHGLLRVMRQKMRKIWRRVLQLTDCYPLLVFLAEAIAASRGYPVLPSSSASNSDAYEDHTTGRGKKQ